MITCLQTCFARNTYGVGYDEKLSDMSARLKSVLAVNGDSYSNSRHKNNGTIIRNGVIYRARQTDMETCVLNWDGTMKIYNPEEINTQQLTDRTVQGECFWMRWLPFLNSLDAKRHIIWTAGTVPL